MCTTLNSCDKFPRKWFSSVLRLSGQTELGSHSSPEIHSRASKPFNHSRVRIFSSRTHIFIRGVRSIKRGAVPGAQYTAGVGGESAPVPTRKAFSSVFPAPWSAGIFPAGCAGGDSYFLMERSESATCSEDMPVLCFP